MNAGTLELVTKHGLNLLEIFPAAKEKDPVKLCRKLRRIECRATELTTAYCNGTIEMGEMEDHLEDCLDAVESLLYRAAAGVPIEINRDPRGYALKIPGDWIAGVISERGRNWNEKLIDAVSRLHRDWGGNGIIAPDLTVN